MKSSFYFLIIMFYLAVACRPDDPSYRVTGASQFPSSVGNPREYSSACSNKSPKFKLYDSTDFPLVIIISNLSPTHPTSCFEKSHHSVIFLAQ